MTSGDGLINEPEFKGGRRDARELVTELSSDIYWEQDDQHRFTLISGTNSAMHEANRAQMIGKRRWDRHYFNMTDAAWAAHRAELEARRPFRDLELGRVNEAGEKVWVSVSGEPMFDDAGAFRGYHGVGKDITGRKRAAQLRELEHTVTRSLAEADSVPEALRGAIRAVCNTEGWDCGRYFSADARGRVLRFSAGWGVENEAVQRYIAGSAELSYGRGEGHFGRVWQSGQPIWVADVSTDERSADPALARASGMRAAFVFPVIAEGGRTIGVLGFNSRGARQQDDDLLQAIGVIGSQIGQFVQRKQAEEVLRESEFRFRTLTELTSDWYWEQDAELRFVGTGGASDARGGITPQAHVGLRRWELPQTEIVGQSWDEHRQALDARQPFTDLLLRRTPASGEVRYVSVAGRPIFDARGAFTGYSSVAKDVTNRIASELALRESEARFRSLTELTTDWYWEQDDELRFTKLDCASGDSRLLASIGRRLWDSDGVDRAAAYWQAHIAQLERRERFQDFEYSMQQPDDSREYFRTSGYPVFDEDGRFRGYRGVARNITQARRGEDDLRRFRAALDGAADAVMLVDVRTGAYLDFNETACRVFGYPREELLRMHVSDIRVDRPAAELLSDYSALAAKPGTSVTDTGLCRRKDRSVFPMEFTRQVLHTDSGQIVVTHARDLTERVRAEERESAHLRYQERVVRFGQSALVKSEPAELVEKAVQAVLEALAADAVAYLEPEPGAGELVLRAVVGVADAGAHPGAIACAEGDPLVQVLSSGTRMLTQGAKLPLAWARELRSAALIPVRSDDKVRGLLCVCYRDPDAFAAEELNFIEATASVLATALQRIDSEARLAYLAQFDPLTGLPNRTLLADRFSQMIVQAKRRDFPLAVLFIDLDEFKMVNDTLGHAGGDALLKEVAVRLQSTVRPGDTVARISGDEFAIVLADMARLDDAALVAQKLIDRLAEAVEVHGKEVFVTASVGIAAYPSDGTDAEALIGAADAAMYRAKQSGRNAYQFYTPEINQRSRARAQLGSELRRALERGEFALVYQPKFELADRRPCGAEALLRWKHPERGTVSPAEFIPVLEETGLIVPVGEWVIGRTCEDLKAWQAAGLRIGPVSVNLSARQFRLQDLDTRVKSLVVAAGIDPGLIELEITESQLMQDPDHAIRVMRALRDAGMRIAIDDFGTGYSSLAYLTRFPVGSLKIDRSFVKDMANSKDDATIVRTIIEMAHSLGYTVVAEGVETEEQANFLRLLRCEQAQGFLFARPMPALEFARFCAA